MAEPGGAQLQGQAAVGEREFQLPKGHQEQLGGLAHQQVRRQECSLVRQWAQQGGRASPGPVPAPVGAAVEQPAEQLAVNLLIVANVACFRRLTNQSYHQKVYQKNCRS